MITAQHQPVMLSEAIASLNVQPGKWYIDGTFGRGGHTRAILEAGGKVLAFDVDHEAIAYGQETFAKEITDNQLIIERSNFEHLKKVVDRLKSENKIDQISGILFDFGTSVDQLLHKDRGFSFDSDAQLDMRMDDRLGVKAKDLIAILPAKQLAEMFEDYGGETFAKPIAKMITTSRKTELITTTKQLSKIIKSVKRKQGKLHPATKVFQALRIAVNRELDSIDSMLPQAMEILDSGSIVTIAFHEGEDRMVKHFFRELENMNLVITERLLPTTAEIKINPRARSAKLRISTKIRK